MKLLDRTGAFCAEFGLDIPIVMAPMAGACPAQLAAAVSNAGGLGSCGALLMDAEQIAQWAEDFRTQSNGAFMLNNWIPDPEPERNAAHEQAVAAFLSRFGPEVSADAADIAQLPFEAQARAMLAARPHIISSIMGLYDAEFVKQMKERKIKWFATVTSLTEALLAEQAGADALVVQGRKLADIVAILNQIMIVPLALSPSSPLFLMLSNFHLLRQGEYLTAAPLQQRLCWGHLRYKSEQDFCAHQRRRLLLYGLMKLEKHDQKTPLLPPIFLANPVVQSGTPIQMRRWIKTAPKQRHILFSAP